jgi:hypothetical protein
MWKTKEFQTVWTVPTSKAKDIYMTAWYRYPNYAYSPRPPWIDTCAYIKSGVVALISSQCNAAVMQVLSTRGWNFFPH